jgi:hypothetical protein
MVLAVTAPEIASCRGYGKSLGTGKEMKEGLFFNRVDMVRAWETINEGVECPGLVLPNPAKASLPIINLAVVSAEVTVNLLFFQLLPKERFLHGSPQ